MTDRELDAAIAERVMGNAICRCDHGKTKSPQFNSDTGECLSCGHKLGRRYSTDPIASQVLKDHMREAGWYYLIDATWHRVYTLLRRPDGKVYDTDAATEPRAFAQAVLATTI